MAIYVTRKCPKCKFSFEKMSIDWIAFGDPRIKCPKCGQIVIFKNIKEWKLRHPLLKFWIVFRHYTFHNLAFTFGIVLITFLLMALVLSLFGKSINDVIVEENSYLFWISISILIFIPIFIYRHKSFIREIKNSNERMKDPNYSKEMELLSKRFR